MAPGMGAKGGIGAWLCCREGCNGFFAACSIFCGTERAAFAMDFRSGVTSAVGSGQETS
jgi:hypothetical protein